MFANPLATIKEAAWIDAGLNELKRASIVGVDRFQVTTTFNMIGIIIQSFYRIHPNDHRFAVTAEIDLHKCRKSNVGLYERRLSWQLRLPTRPSVVIKTDNRSKPRCDVNQ